MKIKKLLLFALVLFCLGSMIACGNNSLEAIELMGAGDRIHDTYTFANIGTKLTNKGNNTYSVSGSVDKLTDVNVKNEFDISDNVTHIVAIKLSAVDQTVVKDEVQVYVNGVENYDAEHLNGSHFTYILLEAKVGITVSISVKWNKNAETINYILQFDQNLELK